MGARGRLHLMAALTLTITGMVLAGCTKGGGGGSGGSGSTGNSPLPASGNWVFQVTPKSSPTPFTSLAGFINEEGQGSNQFVTAALQAQTGACYTDAGIIPMYGGTSGSGLSLISFSVDSQVLSLDGDVASDGKSFTGKYSITGGCADGASGTATGTEYAAVNGTYSGSIDGSSPPETLNLTVAQYTQGTGDGAFLTSGTATFGGIGCFSQGTLAAQNGTVIGNAVNLTFNTNDPGGAQLNLVGTIDTAAQTLTLATIQVNGGSCPGSLGTAVLTLQ